MSAAFKRLWVLPVLLVLALLACQSSWSPHLMQVDESRWLERDRRLLLTDSPWVRRTQVTPDGLSDEDLVILNVSVSWVSRYFQTARGVTLERLGPHLPRLLVFDPGLKTAQARYGGVVRVPDHPPIGLDYQVLVVSPVFSGGLALWPTGIRQSAEAHRALSIHPPHEAEIARELNNLTPLSQQLALDLTISPVLLRSDDPDAMEHCLAQLLGQTLLRGAELVLEDERRIRAEALVVLSHDVDGHWKRAAAGFGENRPRLPAPVVARLLFSRQDENGAALFDETRTVVRLELTTPPGVAESCSKDAAQGLSINLTVPFSLDAMRVAGIYGI